MTADPDPPVERCAGLAARLGEPLRGTAPHAVGWLLVEHGGPWDTEAPASLLDPVLARELGLRCTDTGVRLAAIRRAPHRQFADPRACYAVSSRPGAASIVRVELAETKDLLDLDLAALATGDVPATGTRLSGPVFAVCAHGRRDACCATTARPLRRALRDVGADVWEITHVGGHRFAGNVLTLPHGLLYGRVAPSAAGTIVAATRHGSVVVPLLRGRSALPPPAQAADWFARRTTGVDGIDDVAVLDVDGAADTWTIILDVVDRRLRIVVRHVASGCVRPTSCGGQTADPGRWVLRACTDDG